MSKLSNTKSLPKKTDTETDLSKVIYKYIKIVNYK